MGLPNIIIEFKSKASTAIKRGERGIVAVMVIEDVTATTVTRIDDILQVPTGLTEKNKAYVERTFMGGKKPVKYVQLIKTDSVENGLKKLDTFKFDYLAAPHDISEQDAQKVVTYIKNMRDNKDMKVKAVLPNTAADSEGIINFTTSDIVVGEKTYTAGEYCSRIAGVLAGTPLNVSCTYFILTEVDDVPKFTKAEMDAKIDAGEFVLYHDGDKVKIAREVNSLQDENNLKGDIYKSIKVVDAMDMIHKDIKSTCEDVYVGKYPNNYDNKCLLIVAIKTYLEALRDEEILDKDIVVEVDLEAQKSWLRANGVDVSEMTEQEIKEANTKSEVFIRGSYHIMYAIEDIAVNFEI